MPVLEGCYNAHARTRGAKRGVLVNTAIPDIDLFFTIFIYAHCFLTPMIFCFNANPGMLM
jgi:hypothetical protein